MYEWINKEASLMSSLTLYSVKDSTAISHELSQIFPVKQSRMRDNLAKSLGFNSYNALVAQIKVSPIEFDPIDIYEKLKDVLYERHQCIFEDDTYERLTDIFTNHCTTD